MDCVFPETIEILNPGRTVNGVVFGLRGLIIRESQVKDYSGHASGFHFMPTHQTTLMIAKRLSYDFLVSGPGRALFTRDTKC